MIFEYSAFMNGKRITKILETVVSLMHTNDYLVAGQFAVLLSFLLTMVGVCVRAKGEDFFPWAGIILIVLIGGFVPKTSIAIHEKETGFIQHVDQVPLVFAFPLVTSNLFSTWATQALRTGLQSVDGEKFSAFSSAFPQRVTQAILVAGPVDTILREDLERYSRDCVAMEVLLDTARFEQALHHNRLQDLVFSTDFINPARKIWIQDQLFSCRQAAQNLKTRIQNDIENVEKKLALSLVTDADEVMYQKIRQAMNEAQQTFLHTAYSLEESLEHSMALQTLKTGVNRHLERVDAPLAETLHLARAQANVASEINYRTAARLAKAALPKLRSALEVLVIAVFPLIFLFGLASGRYVTTMLRSYVVLLLWLSLWAPIASVINYLVLATDTRASESLTSLYGGITLASIDSIRRLGATSRALTGALMMLVPVIAYAIAKMSDNGAAAWATAILQPSQQAAQQTGAALSNGNLSVGNVSHHTARTNEISANTHDTSSSFTRSSLWRYSTPYGSVTMDASSEKLTSANRLSTDLGVSYHAQSASQHQKTMQTQAHTQWSQTEALQSSGQTQRMQVAQVSQQNQTSQQYQNARQVSSTLQNAYQRTQQRSVATTKGFTLGESTHASESEALRSGLGARVGNLASSLTRLLPQQSNLIEKPQKNDLSLGSASPVHLGVDMQGMTSHRLEHVASESLSSQMTRLTHDSASRSMQNGQTRLQALTRSHAQQKGQQQVRSVSVNETHNHSQTEQRQSQRQVAQLQSQQDARSHNVRSTWDHLVLQRAKKSYASIDAMLQSSTVLGGTALQMNLEQYHKDHQERSLRPTQTQIDEGQKRDMQKAMQAHEDRILSLRSPVSKESLPQTVFTKENSIESIDATQQLPSHEDIEKAVHSYRSERTGWNTVLKNGLGLGTNYDSPIRHVTSTPKNHQGE